jgi:hypothetical protein
MVGRNGMRDPRILYQYYRQIALTPGTDGPVDEISLECSLPGYYQPPHIIAYGMYCYLTEGYWGRDHGNDEGIPPDGFKRTLMGVYPAGGAFDAGTFASMGAGDGLGGNGITPIVLSSWMHFLDAEVAGVNTAAGLASTLAGIENSLNKVDDIAGAPAMAQSSIDSYLTNFTAEWGYAADKNELWAEEFWTTQRGNGIDAYNSYRRNGYPQNLQPMLETNPGPFPVSMWYPANYAANNSNVTQKSDVTGRVFWNTSGPTVD